MQTRISRNWIGPAVSGGLYLGAAILASRISFSAGVFPTLWLPGGLLLGILLLVPLNRWPAHLLASLPGNLVFSFLTHQPPALAILIYLSNGLEAVAAARIVLRLNSLIYDRSGIIRINPQPAPVGFQAPLDVLKLLIVAAPTGALISAGLQASFVIGADSAASYWAVFRSAWIGHGLGVLAVTPFILAWKDVRLPTLDALKPERVIEAACLFAGLAMWAEYLFNGNALFIGRGFVVMPFLVWAALRFGPKGTTLSGGIVSVIAAWGLVNQLDSFVYSFATIAPNLDLLGIFVSINLVTALFLTTSLEEGRLTAAELRISESRYRRLVESQGEGIGIVDLSETFTFSNPSGNAIFGLTPDESLVGRNLQEFTQPEQFERIQEQTRLRQHNEKGEYEIEIIRPNGERRQILLTATPEHDQNGEINGSFTVFRDITDRIASEQAVQESRARYQALFDHSPIPLWEEDFSLIKQRMNTLRAEGVKDLRRYLESNPEELQNCARLLRVLNVNQAAIQLASQTSPGDLFDHIGPVLQRGPDDVMREEIIAISQDRLDFDFEGPNDLVDGVVRYHHVRWTVAPGSEQDYSHVIVSIVDITNRKRAEEKLRYLSTHDVLTSLYNRNFFEAEMERLQSGRAYPIHLMVVDVNGMKTTNDTFGHAAGDDLLKRTAQVLQLAFRKDDIIARIGGDEFVVMFTGVLPEKEALRRVRECLDEHNLWTEGPPLSLSIGVATCERGNSLVEVFKKADQSMYREKNRYRRSKSE